MATSECSRCHRTFPLTALKVLFGHAAHPTFLCLGCVRLLEAATMTGGA